VPLPETEGDDIILGRAQAGGGTQAFGAMRMAIDLALRGEAEAIATAPVNKEALRAARVPFLDHTAMLRELTGSPEVLTMFSLPRLKIFFMARHMSLRDSLAEITAENITTTLVQAGRAMRRFGFSRPRFGVAAINPHAGEGGMFGREEIDEIGPGVRRAQEAGVDAEGPIPADVVFHLTREGRFDAALSLVHDQVSEPRSITARRMTSPARASPAQSGCSSRSRLPRSTCGCSGAIRGNRHGHPRLSSTPCAFRREGAARAILHP
jgi:4-hydroxythreonine-4-phosphate dehydrogenase